MKTIKLLFAICIAGLISCTSESENLALNQIAQFYECNTSFSKGVSTSSETGSRKTFTVELSGGEVLNQLNAGMIASNSALILYSGLDENEKSNYTHIEVVVNQTENNSTKTTEVAFPVEELKLASSKAAILSDCYTLVQNKDYDGLTSMMSDELKQQLDLESIFTQIDAMEEEHGKLVDLTVQGFEFFETRVGENDMQLLQIYGTFMREKNNIRVYVVMPRAEDENLLYGFNL